MVKNSITWDSNYTETSMGINQTNTMTTDTALAAENTSSFDSEFNTNIKSSANEKKFDASQNDITHTNHANNTRIGGRQRFGVKSSGLQKNPRRQKKKAFQIANLTISVIGRYQNHCSKHL